MKTDDYVDIFDLTEEDIQKYTDLADRLEMLSLREERTGAHSSLFKPRFGIARWIPVRKWFRTVGYRCSHCGNALPEEKYYCPSCLYEMKNAWARPQNDSGSFEDDMDFFELMEMPDDE